MKKIGAYFAVTYHELIACQSLTKPHIMIAVAKVLRGTRILSTVWLIQARKALLAPIPVIGRKDASQELVVAPTAAVKVLHSMKKFPFVSPLSRQDSRFERLSVKNARMVPIAFRALVFKLLLPWTESVPVTQRTTLDVRATWFALLLKTLYTFFRRRPPVIFQWVLPAS